MPTIDELRDTLPDAARDLKVNLQNVLGDSSLTKAQTWGTAYAAALASRHAGLAAAIAAEAPVDAGVLDDARAAAALMGMNNVFYRFKHFVKPLGTYEQKPARLRMQRIAKPASNKPDFELFCLAVSAINGCETCVVSHEKTAREGGITEDQIFDAVRIAATVHGAVVALGD